MSTKLTGYVWDGCAASGMKLSSVAIMARLADFSNDEGVCWPSIETIARQIGAGMSTVRTAIARLEAEGWLTRKARRQGINTRLEQSARIIQRTPDEVLPALVLAATWFDNAARDADIIRRNAITHPGFVPVIPLKVPVQ